MAHKRRRRRRRRRGLGVHPAKEISGGRGVAVNTTATIRIFFFSSLFLPNKGLQAFYRKLKKNPKPRGVWGPG